VKAIPEDRNHLGTTQGLLSVAKIAGERADNAARPRVLQLFGEELLERPSNPVECERMVTKARPAGGFEGAVRARRGVRGPPAVARRKTSSRWQQAPRRTKLSPMQATEFFLTASDGVRIFVRRWLPEQSPRAAIQLVHGLAEHSARYAGLATALTAKGYAVYAHDLRGHGRTAPEAELGYFAARDGWQTCISDVLGLNRAIAVELPGAPIGLLGHSMGSFLAQQFIAEHGNSLFAVVLSASNGRPPPIAALGRLIARVELLRLGPRGKSPLLQQLMFGEFNKRFKPARTAFDWLSRDASEVDRYIADPLCGFEFTVRLAVDLLDALGPLLSPSNIARIPKRLPILVLSGAQDPVGSNLQNLIETYRAAALNVTTRLYEGGRHEMLHETNRAEVASDIAAWFDATLAFRASG